MQQHCRQDHMHKHQIHKDQIHKDQIKYLGLDHMHKDQIQHAAALMIQRDWHCCRSNLIICTEQTLALQSLALARSSVVCNVAKENQPCHTANA